MSRVSAATEEDGERSVEVELEAEAVGDSRFNAAGFSCSFSAGRLRGSFSHHTEATL